MKLAIIIPVYNAANTIGETLDSLQAIDEGWEYVDKVVLCNDESSDESVQIIRDHSFNRCRIELLHHEKNRGEAAAYTTMVESLTEDTDWFLILHSDDLALPNFITRNVEIVGMSDTSVASVSSNFWLFDENREWLSAEERDVVLFRKGNVSNLRVSALVGSWWHISGALVRKQLWVEFGGRSPQFQCSGDWHLLMRWQLQGYTVGYSGIATTKYRQWLSTSLSSSDYPICRDYRERTAVALDLPEVFSGSVRWRFAWQILSGAVRRGLKFALQGKFSQAINAFKIAVVSSARLLFT